MNACARLLRLLCLCWSIAWTADVLAANRLQHHPSPYLKLHGGDPVHWSPWDATVLSRAQRDSKLILVSTGYFSCHWCHVMQRESFQDDAVAQFLNAHFVCVKVDREMRPSLESALFAFSKASNGHAEWPLNVILTPSGYQLAGRTYQTKAEFLDLLTRLSAKWRLQASQL